MSFMGKIGNGHGARVFPLLHDDFPGHMWVKGTVVGVGSRLAKSERKPVVGVETRRLERLRSVVGGNRVRIEIPIDPGDRGAYGDSERAGREAVVVDRHVPRLAGLGYACRPRLDAPRICKENEAA